MAVYTYGLAATDVRDTELSYMSANVDTTLLATCLTRAAGEVNDLIEKHVDDASNITTAAYPNDFELLKRIVSAGAAAYYGWYKTGSAAGFEAFAQTFNNGLTMLRDQPNQLKIVRAQLDGGVEGLHCHALDDTDDTIDSVFGRMVDPTDPDQYGIM